MVASLLSGALLAGVVVAIHDPVVLEPPDEVAVAEPPARPGEPSADPEGLPRGRARLDFANWWEHVDWWGLAEPGAVAA